MINYRYKILQKLGEGGTGEVFLVRDTLYQTQMALKLLSADPARAMNEDEVRKEFATLMTLTHPNLLQVYDFGRVQHAARVDHAKRYFFTMEYVRGTDTLAYLNERSSGVERCGLVEEICIQALGALDYIHRRGIIHFDVKPQNLMVIEDEQTHALTVKLTDFGFSAAKVETLDMPVRGTLEYVAPEFFQGLPVDHRADLYSLGVTLYHLLAGKPPFEAATPVDLAKRVLGESLPPIPDVDRAGTRLCETIARLCSKKPEERYQDAGQALLSFVPSAHEPYIRTCVSNARRPVFVGRTSEIDTVRKSILDLRRLEHPEPSIIAAAGPPGIGRSAFLREVATLAGKSEIFVVDATRFPADNGFPPMVNILRQIFLELHSRGDASIAEGLQPIQDVTGDEPATELEREHYRKKASEALGFMAPGAVEFIVKASGMVPLFIVVDDFEELDNASQNIIRNLLSAREGRWILALGMRHDPAKALPSSSARITLAHLSPLSGEEVLRLTSLSLGTGDQIQALGESIEQLSGGIPVAVVELVEAILAAFPLEVLGGLSDTTKVLDVLERMIPPGLEAYFAQRMNSLDGQQRRLLDVLSCFEFPPPPEILKQVSATEGDNPGETLGGLELEGLVRHTEGNRWSIGPALLRRILYRDIQGEKKTLHAPLAAALTTLPEPREWVDTAEIARHFRLSGDAARAADFYEAAGDKTVQEQHFPHAVKFYSQALQNIQAGGEKQLGLYLKLAKTYWKSNAYRECIETNNLILSTFSLSDGQRALIYTALGKATARLGENAKALQLFQDALRYAPSPQDQFDIQQEIVTLKIHEGHHDEAITLSLAQKGFAEQQPGRELLASVETNLGIAEFFRGNHPASLQSFAAALKIYETTGNKQKTSDTLVNIGNVVSASGNYREALDHWQRALTITGDLHNQYQQAQILNNVGIAHYRLREYEKARSCYESARDLYRQLHIKNGVAFSSTNLGEVALADGQYEAALNFWKEALDTYGEMNDSAGVVETSLQLAQIYHLLGDAGRGLDLLRHADELTRTLHLKAFTVQLNLLFGLLYTHQREFQKASEAYRAAREGNASETSTAPEESLKITLREAELLIAQKEFRPAAQLLKNFLSGERKHLSPPILAEAYYLLGLVARESPEEVAEKPLVFFKDGLSAVANEEVSELSWKLSFSLGNEYAQRGNTQKAKQHFTEAHLILDFFAKQFSSASLRREYLAAHDREQTVSAIASYLGQSPDR